MPNNQLNPLIGIDLGTTYSSIAQWTGTTPLIKSINSQSATPSAFFRNPTNRQENVGRVALAQVRIRPDCVVWGFKREMDYSGPIVIPGFTQTAPGEPKTIVLGNPADPAGTKSYTPVELSASVLAMLYQKVKEAVPDLISRGVVVTVPYYFKAHQGNNTREAARLADLPLMSLLQEPIAASLHYIWEMVIRNPMGSVTETILVFDLGGGTFDLTLFRLEQRKKEVFVQVLATGGEDRLGGLDFDMALVQLMYQKVGVNPAVDWPAQGIAEKHQRLMMQDALVQAITLKEELSEALTTSGNVDVSPGDTKSVDISLVEFETAIAPFIKRVGEVTEQLFEDVNLSPNEVDRVLMVGGSSLVPCVKRTLHGIVAENKVWTINNPLTCVAEGATLYAAYLDDPTQFPFNLHLQTITAHPLGVEKFDGSMDVIIPARTPTPTPQGGIEKIFVTSHDNMTSVDVKVYQGTRPRARDNTLVGTIHCSGLTPRTAGSTPIIVRFEVSSEQTLNVIVEAEGREIAESFKFS